MLSACMLCHEVLLMRLFSIVLWHHFASMIISAAMLGYGMSGTLLTVVRKRAHLPAAYVIASVALACMMPASFMLAQSIPFNPLELLWDVHQAGWLAVVYLLLMLPFMCAGLGIGLVFSHFAHRAASVYACDILGAGTGSLGVIGLLFILPAEKALIAVSVLALVAAGVAVIEMKMDRRWHLPVLIALAGVAGMSGMGVYPSDYKDLSQSLNVRGARLIWQQSGPQGQLSVVENTLVPLRHAPGMSLNSLSEPPPQLGVFVDGDGPSALTKFDGGALAYLDQLTSALPYHLSANRQVLVLGAGAGADVLQALYFGAKSIDAVEPDRNVVSLLQGRFDEYSGHLYRRPEVRVHTTAARGYLDASDARYDLIQAADAFGSAGFYGLSENYLYTVEAMQAGLRHLNPGGMLAVTRPLTLPPRDALKLFATALLALERNGVANPAARLVMIRGWKTVTLLVKNSDFGAAQLDAVREFCRARSFDPGYYPGMHPDEANRYNQLEQAYFFDGATALLSFGRSEFIGRYKFYIAPATDDQPYFFRFFKWDSAAELFDLRRELLDWSYPLLLATLAQAVAASVVLIILPLAFSGCRRSLPSWRVMLYFLCIGFAFMFMEIAYIQKFVLFLAYPLYAVAVVLCAFLVFAAIGSRLSVRLSVRLAAGVIAAVSLLYLFVLPPLFASLMHLPDAAKIAVALALIAPLGICMGVPFPRGMMRLAGTEAIPWAWAINGFASVVGAVLATLLAIHLGFAMVILLAVLLYALACRL